MSKRKFLMVMSQKGGVGKSFTTRLLSRFWDESGVPYTLVDADHRVRATSKTFPEAVSYNLTDQADRIRLLDLATEETEKDFIVDFPGGGLKEIIHFISGSASKELFFETLRQAGYEIVVVTPFTSNISSIMALKDLQQALAGKVSFFLVKNMHGVQVDSLEDEAKRYAEEFGVWEWTIPNVQDHPELKDFNPREFAIQHMGLSEEARDDHGTTANSIRLRAMPSFLNAWVDDYTPFTDAGLKARNCKLLQMSVAHEYFGEMLKRLGNTYLLKRGE